MTEEKMAKKNGDWERHPKTICRKKINICTSDLSTKSDLNNIIYKMRIIEEK